MFSHATVGSSDIGRSKQFYDAALAPLGLEAKMQTAAIVGYGPTAGRRPQFFVMTPHDGEAQRPGNGAMIAFEASARAHVDAVHAAALAAGGRDEGAPGLRPHYHRNYYGAYLRDPDGNKFCVVCHLAE